ncbi:hypothetical protein [Paenibacillus sp. V4I5]|uniref:hypothetical protein n=1 Tax=Paenibacillus sp. V4I5 TaxID=3042306 RepID=UPI00278EC7A2|nr:hypothetical protein [Paenibacillus sp. V4I5]MDQ0913838.1 hypothetical protein [Paenibacillus sp. V4I5]
MMTTKYNLSQLEKYSTGLISSQYSVEDYKKNTEHITGSTRRMFYLKNFHQYNLILKILPVPDRLKLAKDFRGLSNQDLKDNGVTSGSITRFFNYGESEESTSTSGLKIYMNMSIALEIPPEFLISDNPAQFSSGFIEGVLNEIPEIGLNKIGEQFEVLDKNYSGRDSKQPRTIKAFFLKGLGLSFTQEPVFTTLDFRYDFFEISIFISSEISFQTLLLLKLKLLLENFCLHSYYFSPATLRPNFVKVNIIGYPASSTKSSAEEYVQEIGLAFRAIEIV